MGARTLATILFKILGIYWLLHAVVYLIRGTAMPFAGFEHVEGFNWKFEMFGIFLVGILYAIASYLLVLKTSNVIKITNIETEPVDNVSSPGSKDYSRLAFSLLGAFFTATAVTKIVSYLLYMWIRAQATTPDHRFFEQPHILNNLPDLVENILRLIIGIGLLLGAERLSQLWKRLRPLSEIENDIEQSDERR